MKKWMLRLITLLLFISFCTPALAQAPRGTLVVGQVNPMTGKFFTQMWGNTTADIDVRLLVHGYETVVFDSQGMGHVNPTVVKSLEKLAEENGDQTYRVTLNKGLVYSDGRPIEAKDYAFTLMLHLMPQVAALGGNTRAHRYIVGAEDFAAGKTEALAGVRILGKDVFSVTVGKDNFPYYYDLAYALAQPTPSHVLIKGVTVKDDGAGAAFSGPVTEDMLKKALFDEKTGYMTHPKVTSGPYVLTDADMAKGEVRLRRNARFLGNHEGVKPVIERIVMKNAPAQGAAEALKRGEYTLLSKLSAAEHVRALAEDKNLVTKTYPRKGFAFLALSAAGPVLDGASTRLALNRLMDKQSLIDGFVQGMGHEVYGYYGLGQWMAKEAGGKLAELNRGPMDAAEAVKLLEADGWTLDGDGQPYAGQGLRYRRVGGALRPLFLTMGVLKDHAPGYEAASLLAAGLAQAGGELEIKELTAAQLFDSYYGMAERMDVYYMASNFYTRFDPSPTFHPDDGFAGVYNTSGLKDQALYDLAVAMRRTESGDAAAYLDKWLAFQHRFAEVMPLIPLYSNDYTDAYDPALQNYHVDRFESWASAIVYAVLGAR